MTEGQRQHAVTLMREMYARRQYFDYPPGDQRDNRDSYSWGLKEAAMLAALIHPGMVQMDCSEYVPWILRCSGAWPFSQPGYTGSHLQLWETHGWQVYTDARKAYPGAIVIFGPGTGHHEALVLEPDHKTGNPLLSSHGRPQLDQVRLRDEQASQTANGHPGVRILSVAKL